MANRPSRTASAMQIESRGRGYRLPMTCTTTGYAVGEPVRCWEPNEIRDVDPPIVIDQDNLYRLSGVAWHPGVGLTVGLGALEQVVPVEVVPYIP